MKKYLILSTVLVVFLIPSPAKALTTGIPFGGLATVVIPCTCSLIQPSYAIFYAPFFNGLSSPAHVSNSTIFGVSLFSNFAGLYFAPPVVSVPFLDFTQVVPLTWQKGVYTPGASGCFIYVGVGCAPIPTLGTIQFSGSSY